MTDVPHVIPVSPTFARERFAQMGEAGVLRVHEGHFLYPADEQGMHLTRFFSIEPLARREAFVTWIVEDLCQWITRADIRPDLLLAPAQPGVATLAEATGRRAHCAVALWNTLPTGRFHEPTGRPAHDFAAGGITAGQRILIFNGVTQQGRCVGQRLQGFAKAYGGCIAGLAVVAKGTAGMVAEVERMWREKFYATVQVDIPVYAPSACPLEGRADTPRLTPWTSLRL